METYLSPSKEQVREYLKRRFGSRGPVPSISQIRSELGWVQRTMPENKAVGKGGASSEREGGAA